MKIQTKLLIVVAFLSLICTAPAVALYYRSLSFNKSFKQIPQAINNLTNSAELNSTSQYIQYYDEVLTQSARNYAFTGDAFWKIRYNNAVPKLDEKIAEAMSKGTAEDKEIFESISIANQALITMETAAIDLVDQNKRIQAQDILNSTNYAKQKDVYQNGLESYVNNRGESYNDTLSVSNKAIEDSIRASQANIKTNGWITLLISFFCVAAGFTVYFFTRTYIFKPLEKVSKATEEIAKGNLTYEIASNKNDEIGKLADSFDKMAINLDESQKNIAQKIDERTQQLTKLNKYMTGRELKMIELKKEIEKLKGGRS